MANLYNVIHTVIMLLIWERGTIIYIATSIVESGRIKHNLSLNRYQHLALGGLIILAAAALINSLALQNIHVCPRFTVKGRQSGRRTKHFKSIISPESPVYCQSLAAGWTSLRLL